MNQEGRVKIKGFLEQLEDLRSQVGTVGEAIQELADEEREKYDNLPEGLQSSDAGEKLQEAADNLDEAASMCEAGNIDEAISSLESVS